MPPRPLIEKARVWGEHIPMATIDISDAFGRIQYTGAWGGLKAKIGGRCALFRLLVGTSCNICWCGEVLD